MFILTNLLIIFFLPKTFTFDIKEFFGNNTCCLRYQFLDDAKKLINCTTLREINDVCRQNVTVYFTELPPYLYINDKEQTNESFSNTDQYGRNVTGILPGILRKILSEGCCLDCIEINYVHTNRSSFEVLFANITEYEILMPIENSRQSTEYGHNKFVNLLNLDGVSFIGKTVKPSELDLMRKLIESTKKTWPLYVISLSLAICAGSIIWMLDTWFNRKQFPRTFPRGIIEGFWWAYVSMTTVGYGDRTPRSFVAKMFAVLWIMIGITIFNMYTAAITSVLTAELAREAEPTVYMEEVGILNSTTASYSGVVAAFASPKVFDNISSLERALKSDKVKAIALENYMTQHYHDDLISPGINILHQQPIENSVMGMASSEQIFKLMTSFMERNDDSMDVIISNVLQSMSKSRTPHHERKDDAPQPFSFHTEEITLPFSGKSPLFVFLLIGTIIASIVILAVGTLINMFLKKVVRTFSGSKESKLLRNSSKDDEKGR